MNLCLHQCRAITERMKIKTITIRNYRSIKEITLVFPNDNKPLVLFGANNAGKSNILSALHALIKGVDDPPKGEVSVLSNDQGKLYLPSTVKMVPEDKVEAEIKESNVEGWLVGVDDSTSISIQYEDGSIRDITFRKDLKTGKYVSNFDPHDFEVLPDLEGQKYFAAACRLYKEPENFIHHANSKFVEAWIRDMKVDLSNDMDLKEFASIVPKSFEFYEYGRKINPFNLGEGQKSYITRLNVLVQLQEHKDREEKLYKSDKCYLALIDEPETHLHPNAEAKLLETIEKSSKKGIQVIYTTHSENLLNAEFLEGFVRVYNEKGITKVRQLTKTELFHTCHPASEILNEKSPIGDYWSVKLNSDQLKGFFANIILLVEGQTEQYALPIYLGQSCLYKNGIQIVPCYSKTAIQNYWRLFTAYGYKCFILYDYDTDEDKKTNEELKAYFNPPIKTGEHYEISRTAAYFQNNWEEYFKSDLGSEYKTIKDDLKRDYEIPLNEDNKDKDKNKKKELNAKALQAKAIALCSQRVGHCDIPFINDLKDKLEELDGMSQAEYAEYVNSVEERLKALEEQNKKIKSNSR